MDSMFMNSKNSKTLLLNLWDKIKLIRNDKHVPLSILSINYAWKI